MPKEEPIQFDTDPLKEMIQDYLLSQFPKYISDIISGNNTWILM